MMWSGITLLTWSFVRSLRDMIFNEGGSFLDIRETASRWVAEVNLSDSLIIPLYFKFWSLFYILCIQCDIPLFSTNLLHNCFYVFKYYMNSVQLSMCRISI